MKAYSIYLVVICVLLSSFVHAQPIFVEFSLLEKTTNVTDTLAPYLVIKYENKSERDYYLPAAASWDSNIPRFTPLIHRFHAAGIKKEDITSALYEKRLFQNEQYRLLIDFQQMKTQQEWWLDGPVSEEEEIIDPIINEYLSFFNAPASNKGRGEFFSKMQLRRARDLLRNPSLVFLKSGTSAMQLISLRTLKDTGVIITISLSSQRAPDEMIIGWKRTDVYKLPQTVEQYQLYRGEIESNCIRVDFSRNGVVWSQQKCAE